MSLHSKRTRSIVNPSAVAHRTRSKLAYKYSNNEKNAIDNFNKDTLQIEEDNDEWNGIPHTYMLKQDNRWKLLEFDEDFNFGEAEDEDLYKFLSRGAEGMGYVNSTQTKIVKIITNMNNQESIKKEIKLQNEAANVQLAPQIYESELQVGKLDAGNNPNNFPNEFLYFTMDYLNSYEWKTSFAVKKGTTNGVLIYDFVIKLVSKTGIYNDVDPRFHMYKSIYMGQNRIRMIDYGRCEQISTDPIVIYSYYDSYLEKKLGAEEWEDLKKNKKVAASLTMLLALEYINEYDTDDFDTALQNLIDGLKVALPEYPPMSTGGGKNKNVIENDYRLPLISTSILVLSSVFFNLLKN